MAASSAYLLLQKQLRQFTLKPVKVFSIDETPGSILGTHQAQVDTQLGLIQSDELRDKLTDFNEKVKESLATGDDANSSNYLHIMFKDILNSVHRDPEFLNNFTSSLSDVAVSICLVLKNDFNNFVLPVQFYATPTNAGSLNSNNNMSFKSSKMNLNSSDMDINQANQSQQISLLAPNSFTISLVSEAINSKVIFVLFKGEKKGFHY